MTPEDDEKAARVRYALGPRGKRMTVAAQLERAERAEAQVASERTRAAAEERARIVAWLRKWARDERSPLGLAEAIERGEHEKAGGE